MKKRIEVVLLASLVSVTSFFSLGKSAWILIDGNGREYANNQITAGNVEGNQIVCYIDKDTAANQYTSIEVALAKAKENSKSQTIYVKPGLGFTVRIRRDCEIGAGDTLCLPYEGTTFHSYVGGTRQPEAYQTVANRQTYVVLDEGKTLTNNGTLTIGAVQSSGNGGTYPNGNPTGKYAEINLSSNARLLNNGTINCWGYISGNGTKNNSVISTDGSVVNMPFIVIEHRGGSRYTGMAGKDRDEVQNVVNSSISLAGNKTGQGKPVCFVFNRWYLNCFMNVKFDFSTNAKLIGKAVLYADGEHNATDIKLISNDGLVQLKSGGHVSGYFNSGTDKCEINTYGSWNLGNFAVYFEMVKAKIVHLKINISSQNVFLPISHYFKITLNPLEGGEAATVDALGQSFKLLPGSNLIVKSGVTLKTKEIAIYDESSFYPGGTAIERPEDVASSPYPQLDSATFDNFGTITANAIGGIIKNHSGTITSTSNSVVSYEAHNFTSTTITAKLLGIKKDINIFIPEYYPVNLSLDIQNAA